jgi:hypothetical protein
MKGGKFLELSKYFENSKTSHITLSFQEIEKIIGQKLYPSAYKYVQYWNHSKTHTITFSWIDAGYKLDRVDLKNQRVSFVKVG